MDPREYRQQAFRPLSDAFSDTRLQLRAKPVLYVLIWLTLALLPILIVLIAISMPVNTLMTEDLLPALENYDLTQFTGIGDLPSEVRQPVLKILGYSALLYIVIGLSIVYMATVLSGTVNRFREKLFPKYNDALLEGSRVFPHFFVIVLYAVFRVYARAGGLTILALILEQFLPNSVLPTILSLMSFFFFLADLSRYGLTPFIHLSLNTGPRDSARISVNFYKTHRPVVSVLFLCLVMLPYMFVWILFSLMMYSGAFTSPLGPMALFLISITQFFIVMILINFARNTFIKTDDIDQQSGEIKGEAVVLDTSDETEN